MEKEQVETMTADEKIYDVPLRRYFTESGRRKKAPHAIKGVIKFISKKSRSNNIVIGEDINRSIWARGISKPPAKIRIRVRKDGDRVIAELVEKNPKPTKPVETQPVPEKVQAEQKTGQAQAGQRAEKTRADQKEKPEHRKHN